MNTEHIIWKETKYWWIVAMYVIYPLIFTNKYFNITRTKVVTIGVFVTFFLIAGICDKHWKGWKKADIPIMLFGVFQILTLLCSTRVDISILAKKDTNMGIFFWFGMIAIYWIMRMEFWDMRRVVSIVAIGTIIVSVFAMLQYMGVDLFHLYKGLAPSVSINFLSTIGNTAVYGRYLILVYPIIISRIIFNKGEAVKIYYLCAFLYGIAVLIANADAAWLGFFISLWLLAIVSGRKIGTLITYLKVNAVILMGIGIWGLLYRIVAHPRNASRIARLFLRYWYVEVVTAILMYVLCQWLAKRLVEKKLCIGKIVLLIGLLAGSGAVGVMLYYSIVDRSTALGALENYLRYSPTWGTERGYVWTWCANIFNAGSIKDKVIGYGQGMVPILLSNQYGKEMHEVLGYQFINAHNLYLHMLINNGIIGVFIFLWILAKVIIRGFKNESSIGMAIALLSCGIIDLVCIEESITAPWTWILVGLIVNCGEDIKDECRDKGVCKEFSESNDIRRENESDVV